MAMLSGLEALLLDGAVACAGPCCSTVEWELPLVLISSRKNRLAASAAMMGATDLEMLAASQDRSGLGCLEGAWELLSVLLLSRKMQLDACFGRSMAAWGLLCAFQGCKLRKPHLCCFWELGRRTVDVTNLVSCFPWREAPGTDVSWCSACMRDIWQSFSMLHIHTPVELRLHLRYYRLNDKPFPDMADVC